MCRIYIENKNIQRNIYAIKTLYKTTQYDSAEAGRRPMEKCNLAAPNT